jgi:hypothetical protein
MHRLSAALAPIQGTGFGADPNAFCRKFHDAAHNAIKMQTPCLIASVLTLVSPDRVAISDYRFLPFASAPIATRYNSTAREK